MSAHGSRSAAKRYMKITCPECGGVESPCFFCGDTGKVEIPGDTCPHRLTGTATTEFCVDCGEHRVGGEWMPSPGMRIAELTRTLEQIQEKVDEVRRVFEDKEELYRHALMHVVECDNNCSDCKRLARDTLNRTGRTD